MPITPTKLAHEAGISVSYASQILNGARGCSQEVALVAFRVFGVRLGLLAEMTDADIDKLCGRCGPVDHAAADSAEDGGAAAGKSNDITAHNEGVAA